MDFFEYRDGQLFCEEVPVRTLADEFGTPLWVYSRRTVLHHYHRIAEAFAEVQPLICYSIKANSNLALCRVLAEAGSGFDVVSGGELWRALKAGGRGDRIVFAGVGKTPAEIAEALDAGVLMFNVESAAELETVNRVAVEKNTVAPVALRINPDIDPKTHTYITTGKKETKFGLDLETAGQAGRAALQMPGVEMKGVHLHIGSQITTVDPYAEAVEKGVAFVRTLRDMGHSIRWLNMGGGFGIHYKQQEARTAAEFARVVLPFVREAGCRLVLEPGRFVVGNAGILVSRVLYTKPSGGKMFVIQDAAMNDLVRPALYGGFHRIWPVQLTDGTLPPADYEAKLPGTVACDVVGPVCESGDFLAKDRRLPPTAGGDLLATFSAGAYGMVMSSNYNSRPRAAEVLVDGDGYRCVRRRETYEDLVAPELDNEPEG